MDWVIIASGPSLKREDVDYCRGKAKVIAINNNYLLAPWADYLYFCDLQWIEWQHQDHKAEIESFGGEIWTQDRKAAIRYGYKWIESYARCGLSTNPKAIHQGDNSGYQSINLAYHFGARRIILLGYDMQCQGEKRHWFGDHPNKVKSDYKTFRMFFATLADHAERVGLEIINCSRETALTCFPRMPLEKALESYAALAPA